MIEGYTTVAEIAKKWGVKPRTVQIMCAEGRIAGVTKFGRAWAIPVDADKPKDNRIITGQYKDWRKTQKNSEGWFLWDNLNTIESFIQKLH